MTARKKYSSTMCPFDYTLIHRAWCLPATKAHVLTNGRRFAEPQFTSQFAETRRQAIWAVPLYADTAARHDYIVQAAGAFAETVHGLYELGEWKHRIEIRCVLHAQTVDQLSALAEFIYRNLPFVEHVALLGLEPMGYARGNRGLLWVDPADYQAELRTAIWHLAERDIPVSIYNLPLCVLHRSLWPFSISGWKNVYAPGCENCAVSNQCCGFFRSADRTWRSRSLKPVTEAERHA
jgi:His-Xaa-Ser system radical SAM maturase HxsC